MELIETRENLKIFASSGLFVKRPLDLQPPSRGRGTEGTAKHHREMKVLGRIAKILGRCSKNLYIFACNGSLAVDLPKLLSGPLLNDYFIPLPPAHAGGGGLGRPGEYIARVSEVLI